MPLSPALSDFAGERRLSALGRAPRPSAAIVPLPRLRPKVLFVTPESGDFLQAGGLGAVAASLPRALRRDCDVRVLAPGFPSALKLGAEIEVVARLPGAGEIPPCSIGRTATGDGLPIYLVMCAELYDRPGSPYADASGQEHPDNDLRFARLSLAAAEFAELGLGGWRPDVTHLNDWPAALTAGYLKWRGAAAPTVLTLHNLAHQGLFDAERREALAIPEAAFTREKGPLSELSVRRLRRPSPAACASGSTNPPTARTAR